MQFNQDDVYDLKYICQNLVDWMKFQADCSRKELLGFMNHSSNSLPYLLRLPNYHKTGLVLMSPRSSRIET